MTCELGNNKSLHFTSAGMVSSSAVDETKEENDLITFRRSLFSFSINSRNKEGVAEGDFWQYLKTFSYFIWH